jgi:hypothetical protein
MSSKQWKIWFKSKNQDQLRFHKAFTFTLADTEEQAKQRVINVRPDEIVQILSCEEMAR